jgi:hypothetical protein
MFIDLNYFKYFAQLRPIKTPPIAVATKTIGNTTQNVTVIILFFRTCI